MINENRYLRFYSAHIQISANLVLLQKYLNIHQHFLVSFISTLSIYKLPQLFVLLLHLTQFFVNVQGPFTKENVKTVVCASKCVWAS